MELSLIMVPVATGVVGYVVGRWWVLASMTALIAVALLPVIIYRDRLTGSDGDEWGLFAFVVLFYAVLALAGAAIGVTLRHRADGSRSPLE
jgi:hypothetical protein